MYKDIRLDLFSDPSKYLVMRNAIHPCVVKTSLNT